jgi:hypothetical protein
MVGIAFFFALLLCGLAVRANSHFRNEDRLPMQWRLTGDVTWSAPRVLALAFIPTLATGILMINAVLALNLQPRPGQERMVLPTFIGVGIVSVGIQLLHFWLIEKTLHRDGS